MSDNNKIKLLPPIKRYVNAVERRLNLPLKIKLRVMSDFTTTISARHEQGESYEDIISSLGSPAQAAAELNEQMKEYAYRRSPWRWVCLIAAAFPLWHLLQQVALAFLIKGISVDAASVGIIGGADGPTAILVTSASIGAANIIKIIIALAALGAAIYGFIKLGRLKGRDR